MNPFDLKAGAARPPRAARGDRPLFHRALYRRGAFDLIAVWKKDRTLAFAAYYNWSLGWQLQLGGTPRGSPPRRCGSHVISMFERSANPSPA